MKVQIEGSLYLESDEYQFILKEYTGSFGKPRREGEQPRAVYKHHGYFPTVESAMLKVLTMKVKDSTAQSLSELIRDVNRIKQEISKSIQF